MEKSTRATELTTLVESRITNFYTNFQVDEIGRVVSVGDGIARVYGLNEIQAGEMVEFASGVKGIALNLENENVGIVVFGSDTVIKEGDLVKRTGSIVDAPAGKAMLGRVIYEWGVSIDGRGSLSDHERRRVEVKAPGIIERKSVHEPMQTELRAVEKRVPKDRWGAFAIFFSFVFFVLFLHLNCNEVLAMEQPAQNPHPNAVLHETPSNSNALLPGPSSWNSTDIRDLWQSWSNSTDSTSVNQPQHGPIPPSPVVYGGVEAAQPTLRAVNFPYKLDQVIGGDSVLSIQQRLLSNKVFPAYEVIRIARLEAQDLFEVKVEIVQMMAGLDPTGDWAARGARALDNPHSPTGEESLKKLNSLLDDLRRDGVQSATYSKLKGKVFLGRAQDEHSSA